MKCPKCKLFNPPTALRCDCGYDFEAKEVKGSYLYGNEVSPSTVIGSDTGQTITSKRAKGFGILLNGLGFAVCLFVFFQLQNWLILLGLALFGMSLGSLLGKQKRVFHKMAIALNIIYGVFGLLGLVSIFLNSENMEANEVLFSIIYLGGFFLLVPIMNVVLVSDRLKAISASQ